MKMYLDFTKVNNEIVEYDLADGRVVNGQMVARKIIFREFIDPYLSGAKTPLDVHNSLLGILIGNLTNPFSMKSNCELFDSSLERRRMIMNSMKLIERNYNLSSC